MLCALRYNKHTVNGISPYIACINGGSLPISCWSAYWRFALTSGSEREAELNMMQCVFTGIPRVGKSSFWKRLQGMMPDRVLASTDITSSEGSVRLDVRGSCGFVLQVSEHGWRKLQAEEEMEGFVALVTQQGSPFQQQAIQDYLSVPSTAVAGQQSNVQSRLLQETTLPKQEGQPSVQQREQAQPLTQKEEGVHEKPVESASAHKGKEGTGQGSSTDGEAGKGGIGAAGVKEGQLPSASAVLKKALISLRQTELSKRIDSASYVLCTDTGGQPEFQELLSLLMAECNSVFIIFNMLHDLYSTLILQYLPSVDGEPVSYESPHTVAEMLYQSLISVPVESSSVRASETDSQDVSGDGEILNRSSVFFIGTHKDKVSTQRIEAVNRELIELIRHTPQYKANIVSDAVIVALSFRGQLLFSGEGRRLCCHPQSNSGPGVWQSFESEGPHLMAVHRNSPAECLRVSTSDLIGSVPGNSSTVRSRGRFIQVVSEVPPQKGGSRKTLRNGETWGHGLHQASSADQCSLSPHEKGLSESNLQESNRGRWRHEWCSHTLQVNDERGSDWDSHGPASDVSSSKLNCPTSHLLSHLYAASQGRARGFGGGLCLLHDGRVCAPYWSRQSHNNCSGTAETQNQDSLDNRLQHIVSQQCGVYCGFPCQQVQDILFYKAPPSLCGECCKCVQGDLLRHSYCNRVNNDWRIETISVWTGQDSSCSPCMSRLWSGNLWTSLCQFSRRRQTGMFPH